MQIPSLTPQRSAIDDIVMLTAISGPTVCWVEDCHMFHGVVGLLKSTSGNDAHKQTLARTANEIQAATLTRIQHAAEMKSRKQTLYSSSRHISNRKTDIPRPSSHHPKSFPGHPSKNFSLLCEPINEYRIAPPNVGTRHIGALSLRVASKLMSCRFEVESHHSRLRTALHGFRVGS